MIRLLAIAVCCWIVWDLPPVQAGKPPQRDGELVELVGKASEQWFNRNWRSYYWREDFTFMLKEDGTDKTWRIISREPTPAYGFRMGTTFPPVDVDWKSGPRVKVIGVKAIDRIPEDFYDFKLKEPNLATALMVYVEAKPNVWKEYFVNNWFHKWGEKADKTIFGHYAGKGPPYHIFGYARSQAAPFDARSQAIIDKNKDNPSLMFQGRVKASKEQKFGYEIELIDLLGRDVKTGGHVFLHGDGKTIPLLDGRAPPKK